MGSGVYNLVIYLKGERRIQVGRLGCFWFPAGYYVYTGSALNGLEARIARHLRKEKRKWWHVDYLLEWAEVAEVRRVPTRERKECALNRKVAGLTGARVVAPGFGASDCTCETHLFFFETLPEGIEDLAV
jgi:sugar fermentation stimulation protein A